MQWRTQVYASTGILYCVCVCVCMCVCVCVCVCVCGCVDVRESGGDVPCSSVRGSRDSLGWHIHLCLFAKFDFKYLSRHTSWLKQIAGKVLLSVKHVVRRMEALEGTSMFHLAKYMTEEVYVQPQHFSTQEGDNGVKTFSSAFGGGEQVFRDLSHALSEALYFVCCSQRASLSLIKTF